MIPKEGLEAAKVAYLREFAHDENAEYIATLILEAAAPHIRAQTADLIADGMQAWAGDSERAYVQGFAEAAWGKVPHVE